MGKNGRRNENDNNIDRTYNFYVMYNDYISSYY